MAEGSSLPLRRWRQMLDELPGVIRAGFEIDSHGAVSRVQVVASGRVGRHLVIRNVRSLMLLEAGVDIPLEAIDLISLNAESIAALWPAVPEVGCVESCYSGGQVRVTVELLYGAETVRGTVSGFAQEQPVALAARAALEALCFHRDADRPIFALENVCSMPIGGRDAVIVTIRVIEPSGRADEIFLGAAPSDPEPTAAAVRAVIEAVLAAGRRAEQLGTITFRRYQRAAAATLNG
ncbi:MAG: hypothetical protein WD535_06000 [Thermaerobacterales bacterium]